MRGIDLPRVPDDAINENQIFVLDDPTQSFSITLAQLKEFIKAYLDDVFVNANGDTMTDRLIIERDSDAMRLKNDTQGKPIYILCQDLDGTTRFYLGIAEDGTSDVSLHNYIGGGNRITLSDDGAILLTPMSGAGITASNMLMVNGDVSALRLKSKTQGKSLFILAQDADGSNSWFVGKGTDAVNSVEISNYKAGGNKITLQEDSAVIMRNAAGSVTLHPDGAMSLTKYDYFDVRYLRMPSAGGVGDVAMVKLNNSDQFLHGSTVPGSSLSYASLQGDASGQDPDIITEAKTLSGTWRITGTLTSAGGAQYLTKLTTAIRIA